MARLALFLSLLLGCCGVRTQAQAPASKAPAAGDVKTAQALSRGTQLAAAVSTVTSTAISPLLGVCVLGGYEYFHTAGPDRHKLPIYTSPWFWIPVACLLVIILLKDTVGGAAPLLKKPLDAVEVLIVNKASLFLIAFPVVFHEVAKVMGLDSLSKPFAVMLGGMETVVYAQDLAVTAQQVGQAGLAFILLLGGIVIATVVWLVGHAFDVLLLLSPFPFLDVLLKGMRTVVFIMLAGLTLLDAGIAALFSVFVIVIAMLLSGWAFRLLVFGARFSWDLLRTLVFRSYREPEPDEQVLAFTAMRLQEARKRTSGYVRRREDGGIEFAYRPWMFSAERAIPLDPAATYAIGRGLFYPTLIETKERSSRHKTLVRMLPRYRKSEEKLAAMLGAKDVRDLRLGRGLHAFWQWLKDDTTEAEV